MLHAGAPVPGIYVITVLDLSGAHIDTTWPHHSLIVEVAMYVAAKAGEARFVHRHMAQYHTVHDMVGSDLAEMPFVILEFEYVMVAFDQDLVTVETMQELEALPVDHDISEVIYFVAGFDSFVPALHHDLVHLFGTRERAQWCAIRSLEYRAGLFVTKVRVAD